MKRISPATVTFGLMAVVLGLVAAYIVRQAYAPKPVAKLPEPAPPAMVTIIIARNNLPKNTLLTLSDLDATRVKPDDPMAKDAFTWSNQAAGRVTKRAMRAGQVMREDLLLPAGQTFPELSERLPAGHRAVTINVANTEAAGKRLEEGDHVDVLLTVEGKHPDLGEVQTRTILTNALVMETDSLDPRHGTGRNRIVETSGNNQLTLAVIPADANKLVVAQRTGVLSVSLCGAEAGEGGELMVSKKDLLGLREISVPEKPVIPPPPKKFTIEKWSGGRVQILEMSEDRINEARRLSLGETEDKTTRRTSLPSLGE